MIIPIRMCVCVCVGDFYEYVNATCICRVDKHGISEFHDGMLVRMLRRIFPTRIQSSLTT